MNQSGERRNGLRSASTLVVLIGVGANLPASNGRTAVGTCRQAIATLDSFPGLRLRALSRWFLSAPDPPSDQPPYVNAVASLLVDAGLTLDPAVLLGRLMTVETAFERKRGAANAARTLDLDIIAISDWVRAAPDPILPHPRAHLRCFVLAPLLDVAPDWMHPVLGRSAAALLANLPPQNIQPLRGI